jgi:hypothetical protein
MVPARSQNHCTRDFNFMVTVLERSGLGEQIAYNVHRDERS